MENTKQKLLKLVGKWAFENIDTLSVAQSETLHVWPYSIEDWGITIETEDRINILNYLSSEEEAEEIIAVIQKYIAEKHQLGGRRADPLRKSASTSALLGLTNE
jgi:hypothetical protein